MRARRRFLVLAAAWDLAVAAALLLVPEGRAGVGAAEPVARTRLLGWIVLAFGGLYAASAVRPARPLLVFSAVAKSVGGSNGVIGAVRGRRDLATVVSLADALWVPGFVLAARAGLTPRRGR